MTALSTFGLLLVVNPKLTSAQSSAVDPKPGDPPGEAERRGLALGLLGEAMENETRVRAEAARACQARAEEACWLGASLLDLSRVTGRSRQAARKRWTTLGAIAERRRWLSNHVEDILSASRLVLQHDAELDCRQRASFTESFTTVCSEMAADVGSVTDPAMRWHLLEELVNTHLRSAGDPARGQANTEEAQFARDGAYGVVAYYDHATQRPTQTA